MRRLVLLAVLGVLLAGCARSSSQPVIPGTAKEALESEITMQVPSWINVEHLPANAVPGAKLFAVAGCAACHTYNGAGRRNLGAPDLTAIGSRNLGVAFQIKHLKCPWCVNPGSPMPPFKSLGPERLKQLGIFLEASKGATK